MFKSLFSFSTRLSSLSYHVSLSHSHSRFLSLAFKLILRCTICVKECWKGEEGRDKMVFGLKSDIGPGMCVCVCVCVCVVFLCVCVFVFVCACMCVCVFMCV